MVLVFVISSIDTGKLLFDRWEFLYELPLKKIHSLDQDKKPKPNRKFIPECILELDCVDWCNIISFTKVIMVTKF